MARPPDNTLPDHLPDIFRWSDARDHGLTDARLARLETDGIIEKLDPGLYARSGAVTKDLALAFEKAGDRATLCPASALSRADLIDEIPALIHVALPRGTHQPWTSLPIRWHSFNAETFDLGRLPRSPDSGLEIGMYSPERSICDASGCDTRKANSGGRHFDPGFGRHRPTLRSCSRWPGTFPRPNERSDETSRSSFDVSPRAFGSLKSSASPGNSAAQPTICWRCM